MFKAHRLYVVLILLLSLFSIYPFFYPGLFHIHDDTQVARVYEMGKALKDGNFPVRWVQDLGYGYGYPLFNFYAPLAYYIGGFFSLVGLSALLSTKFMMILGILLSAVCMYIAAQSIWGKYGGFIAALFYLYAPYHAVDIYVRGDVAEFLAYAFIPLLLYGLSEYYKKEKYRYIVVTICAYAAIILSHNLTGLMITPFFGIEILCYGIAFYRKKKFKQLANIFSIPVFAVLVSAFYWLPALGEMHFTNVLSQVGGGADYRDHFVCVSQFWNSFWGYGGSAKGCLDGLSFRIGKLQLVLLAISVLFSVRLIKKQKYQFTIAIASLCLFIVSILLTLEMSRPIWELIPIMAFFQYPWRFLGLASFFLALFIGSLFSEKNIRFKKVEFSIVIPVIIIVCILLYVSVDIFKPQRFDSITNRDYLSDYNLKWETSKISDEYMPSAFIKPFRYEDIPQAVTRNTEIKTTTIVDKTNRIKVKVSAKAAQKTQLRIAYFPFWKIYINNAVSNYKVEEGKITIEIPQGDSIIEAVIHQTQLETFSNILSIIGMVVLVTGIIIARKRSVM